MSINKRLTIGLMVSDLDDAFSKAVCKGVISCASDNDANVIIMPGRYIDAVYDDKVRTEFEYQYNTLFSYGAMDGIDVLLVLIGTIGCFISEERKKAFLSDFSKKPIITLAARLDGYPSVTFDNTIGLREEIEHIINDHGRKRIGFVSGPKTNTDAIERLEVYKDTLIKNNITPEEKLIAYGDFSPYCTEPVKELLENNPDIDAVIFANDNMAESGYEVIKRHGYRIGKDISVAGFDDSPNAEAISPMLTTVRADAVDLGYEAAQEALTTIASGHTDDIKVVSSMVKRLSCGCTGDFSDNERIYVFNGCECKSISKAAEVLSNFLIPDTYSNAKCISLKDKFYGLVNILLYRFEDENGQIKNGNCSDISRLFSAFLQTDNMEFIDTDRLCSVIMYLQKRVLEKCGKKYDVGMINGLFISIYRILTRAVANYGARRVEQLDFLTWQSNAILKDMLAYNSCDDSAYGSVSDKLMRLTSINSSYLYIFHDSIPYTGKTKWIPPEDVLLKSYHNDLSCHVVPAPKQKMKTKNIFNNIFIPSNRRFTMVLSSVSLNVDHYGLLLCEVDERYFYTISPLVAQLSGAMKIIRLIQDKELIQRELEHTLTQIQEKNQQLDEISKIDELTCVFNRRGFFAKANSIINSAKYSDRNAMIIFADLNYLKIINDRFSHEDGDFAIKSAADILTESFRSTDVIGRIGGDEFSVLTLIDETADPTTMAALIRKRITETEENFNQTHNKPYLVQVSLGMYQFKCSRTIDLNDILSRADSLLYDDKKKKKSILRQK